MKTLLAWVKRNWTIFLILFLGYLLLREKVISPSQFGTLRYIGSDSGSLSSALPAKMLNHAPSEAAPAPEAKNRMVVQNSWLSLLVKNVRQAQKEVIAKAGSLGGYMVESQIDSPEQVDSATVTVRVPAKKLTEALETYRGLAVRVVSENLVGYDVTDEYVDIDSRLETLNRTKTKYEEILAKAERVEDIMNVQRELINLQSQIDSLKGQQKYLEKNAEMAKVTVYLSTDELALPYAPAQPWRPSVIFKQAVRSLVSTFRGLGTAIIWVVAYVVIWVPVVGIYLIIKKKRQGKI